VLTAATSASVKPKCAAQAASMAQAVAEKHSGMEGTGGGGGGGWLVDGAAL
jgi:hypothetical protein